MIDVIFMGDCIFCKIANREIPKEFTYEDNDVMVFPDIHPVKPIHLLIMPKKHIKELFIFDDNELWIKLKSILQKMIKEKGLENHGYQALINGGGLQDVDHLHIHLKGPMKG